MKFKLEVTETLQRTVEIHAESFPDAVSKIKKLYQEGKIILDSSDYVGVEIDAVEFKGDKLAS